MKKLQKQKQKKKHIQLQRLLLDLVPETPVPQPYFNIPSPDPYRFPLGQTMLEGIKLLEHYFPQDINSTINSRLGLGNVQRMTRYNDIYCMMGKNGNGLIIGKQFLNITQITAFSYGPNYLLVAFQDLRLQVYSLELKLIKVFKKFFNRTVTFLKLLSVPKGYQSIVFLSHDNRDISVHRLQKSLLSKLSSKLQKKIIQNLQHPVTQMFQLPKLFKRYLSKDFDYRDCSLMCISSVNRIDILRINHFRLDFDNFIQIVYTKKVSQLGSNTISWGQTRIQAPSRQMKGEKLVLVVSFSSKIIFLALQQRQKFMSDTEQIITKYDWIESYPFTLKNKEIAFCQFIKKNQFIIITDKNDVMVFNTKNFDIFQKPISSDQFQIFTQSFEENLQNRVVKTIQIKSQKRVLDQQNEKIREQMPQVVFQMKKMKKQKAFINALTKGNWQQLSRQQQQTITQLSQNVTQNPFNQPQIEFKNIVTFADSFTYEYPSSQIYYLVKSQKYNFGVYVYCNWKLISDLLRIDKKFQQCMLFLIAIYKKANKFDLGVQGSQQEISKYIQQLSIQFINRIIGKYKNDKSVQADIQTIVKNEQYFKNFIKPIEFLTETQQFAFLFQVAQQKLIASLISQHVSYQKQYKKCRDIFFTALIKFIQHGRIKSIPQSHLQLVLDYYVENQRYDLIDKLAIYFDLQRIDTGTLVQCLLQNDLTVSLAHVCIQGNQSLFVTPFVKFWGVSANFKYNNQIENASIYSVRALWYVKLCLQRNWALKQYSFQKYSEMIRILSRHFLSQKIIVTLLQIRPQECLQSLNLYFNIQNSMIVNGVSGSQNSKHQKKDQMKEYLKEIAICDWIVCKEQNETLQRLLSALNTYMQKAKIFLGTDGLSTSNQSQKGKARIIMNLFLSSIIIYRTVKFSEQKYFQILIDLINNYRVIKDIKYGLQDQLLQEYRNQYYQFSEEQVDEVLSSRYIIRILTLVYYQNQSYIQSRLISIYEKARQFNLMDLQAEICLINNQFNNAVDIYLRARPNLRIWIFQFLENSFKKLMLQKKKSEKKRMGDILTQKIKSLVELDSMKTKQLVDNYLPQNQQQLIMALSDNQQLQLDYLQQIISSKGTSAASTIKSRLSQKSIMKYVELMARMKPDLLLQSFKNNAYFPIDECIKICQQQDVYDCLQYLYEKSGSSMEAVKIAMKRIDGILRKRVAQNQQYQDEDFTHYIKIKQILDHSIQLCKITKSQDVWQALLDSSIQLYNKYDNTDFPQDEIQIFFFINGQIMEHLASNCQVQHVIDLLQNKYQNLNMGGKMTKAFITILANLSHSINIMFVAESMIQDSYHNFLIQDYQNKISGVGGEDICKACNFGIMKRKNSIHFHCHHSYHKQCLPVEQVKPGQNIPALTCVYCLLNQIDQFQYHINSINSARNPKVKKISDIFTKFNSQNQQMSDKLAREQKQQLDRKQQSVMLKNVQKKRVKLQNFDQMIFQTQDSSRRVLRELRMY